MLGSSSSSGLRSGASLRMSSGRGRRSIGYAASLQACLRAPQPDASRPAERPLALDNRGWEQHLRFRRRRHQEKLPGLGQPPFEELGVPAPVPNE
jgi:hypothetical protein